VTQQGGSPPEMKSKLLRQTAAALANVVAFAPFAPLEAAKHNHHKKHRNYKGYVSLKE
jgi:hypothetical protein